MILLNYISHLSSSQGMSYLREKELIIIPCWLRVFVPSSLPYLDNRRVIEMPLDGVLWFYFQINFDQGDCWGWGITLELGEEFVDIHKYMLLSRQYITGCKWLILLLHQRIVGGVILSVWLVFQFFI